MVVAFKSVRGYIWAKSSIPMDGKSKDLTPGNTMDGKSKDLTPGNI